MEAATSTAAAAALGEGTSANDALTQILMCVYFFLAGVAVSTSPVLWMLPLATVLSAMLFAATATASRWLLPFYSSLSRERCVLWNLQAVHVLYSAVAATCAAGHMLSHPSSLHLTSPQTPVALPQALAAASAGFFGFVLAIEVRARLYKRNHLAVFHYTVLLVLFSAASYKSINTSFLVVTLLSEINSVFLMARRQAAIAGVQPTSTLARGCAVADGVTFFLFRLLPHAALGTTVITHPQAFSSAATYWLAAAGMGYMNVANVKHAVTFWKGSKSDDESDGGGLFFAKEHAA